MELIWDVSDATIFHRIVEFTCDSSKPFWNLKSLRPLRDVWIMQLRWCPPFAFAEFKDGTELYRRFGFGKGLLTRDIAENEEVVFSALETAFLMRAGVIVLGSEPPQSDQFVAAFDRFDVLYSAFCHLCRHCDWPESEKRIAKSQSCAVSSSEPVEMPWTVRSGIRFGFDFLLYSSRPEVVHSEFGVIVLTQDELIDGDPSCLFQVCCVIDNATLTQSFLANSNSSSTQRVYAQDCDCGVRRHHSNVDRK